MTAGSGRAARQLAQAAVGRRGGKDSNPLFYHLWNLSLFCHILLRNKDFSVTSD